MVREPATGNRELRIAIVGPAYPFRAGIAYCTTRLAQGSLEASNVDLSEAMTSMIEAQRGFELASKAIEVQDQMLQIANQVKR